MLETRDLTFAYPSEAFNFPDLSCSAGEVLLVTGRSGAGKTTLLHLIGGLLRPDSGQISLDNYTLDRLGTRALDKFRGERIGIVFQQAHFISALSVLENITICSHRLSRGSRKQLGLEQLQQFGLESLRHQRPENLSQGQLQRLSIARALINQPKLLLADEPTSSLDEENCRRVACILEEQAKTKGCALVIVTHDQRLKSSFKNQVEL